MTTTERVIFTLLGLGAIACGTFAMAITPDVPTATATLSEWLFRAMMLWQVFTGVVFVFMAILVRRQP